MPSLALGLICCTAWARTWAAEWRRTARPSSLSSPTGSTRSPSARTWARSRSSPLTRATTVALSPPNRSAAVVPAVIDRWLPATETVMSADDTDADDDGTVGSCKVETVCRPVGRPDGAPTEGVRLRCYRPEVSGLTSTLITSDRRDLPGAWADA